MHAAAENSQRQKHASRAREEFDELLRPLEQKAGRRLNGPNRERCFEAFVAYPDGFAHCVEDALARGRRGVNPVGLLWVMVRDGDHEHETPQPETFEERMQRRMAEHDDSAAAEIRRAAREREVPFTDEDVRQVATQIEAHR